MERVGNLPVIVVTIRDDFEFHAKLYRRFPEVVKHILVKPVTPTTIVGVIKNVLS